MLKQMHEENLPILQPLHAYLTEVSQNQSVSFNRPLVFMVSCLKSKYDNTVNITYTTTAVMPHLKGYLNYWLKEGQSNDVLKVDFKFMFLRFLIENNIN